MGTNIKVIHENHKNPKYTKGEILYMPSTELVCIYNYADGNTEFYATIICNPKYKETEFTSYRFKFTDGFERFSGKLIISNKE